MKWYERAELHPPIRSSPPQEMVTLIGRDGDIRRMKAFLSDVDGSPTLLLTGEAGVGKSALLEAVANCASAAGTRVLRAGGAEFEADVSYCALNQLLLPLRTAIKELDEPYRQALRTALGFDFGPPPGYLLVCNATLMLLDAVATERPLLLIVDDLSWIDQASAAVLRVVARRLTGNRIRFFGALRSGAESSFERGDLPEYEVSPLDEESASLLVSARIPGIVGAARRRLLEAAQGNPLALLELPAGLSRTQWATLEDLPTVLPLSRRLQATFASRVNSLPSSSQRMLLLAALEGTGELSVLQAAAECLPGNATLDDLAAAERDRLVSVSEARHVVFRHPLICSAVVGMSTSSERRTAHRALAEVLADKPERRAWHLGEATIEPDETVARMLEDAAHRTLRSGDAAGAVRALTRAAHLSPVVRDLGRRLAEAAYVGAEFAGVLRKAHELLEAARRVDPQVKDSLHFAAAAATLTLHSDSDLDSAHRLLSNAIESGAHGYDAEDETLIHAIHVLALLSYVGGRRELWDPVYDAIARLRPLSPPLLTTLCKTLSDPIRTGSSALGELDRLLAQLPQETDQARIVRAGTASLYADRLDHVREPSWRVVRQGRDGGSMRGYFGGLFHLALDDYMTGHWDEASQLASEGAQLCSVTRHAFFAWPFWSLQAMIAAARGEEETSRELSDRITRWATARGMQTPVHYALHARTLLALGAGDFDNAYHHASAVSPAGTLVSHVPHALWLAMDLTEAAMRSGRQAEAISHARAIEEADVAALSPRLALLAGGSAAMSATDNATSDRLFDGALASPGAERWAFDHARVQLAHGERLRRNRATVKSRAVLGAALAKFQALGATPWVERTAKELRAAGSKVPHTREPKMSLLTPQELEIVRLAASGLTNKEIARLLFVSPRTVGAHLYQVFPKLGITSRTMLRDVLEEIG
ncbi:AAA family ATPase [Streptomyces sp. NPDC008222]|uniref:AAA family ATPase n=1 Tax=Streptomyces sp. NPDC008222 TaxID=3364820 RepID=UPI0036E7BE41